MNVNPSFSILTQLCRSFLEETRVTHVHKLIQEFRQQVGSASQDSNQLVQTFRSYLLNHPLYEQRVHTLLQQIASWLGVKEPMATFVQQAMQSLSHPIQQETLFPWFLETNLVSRHLTQRVQDFYTAEFHVGPISDPDADVVVTKWLAEARALEDPFAHQAWDMLIALVTEQREVILAMEVWNAKHAPPDPLIAVPNDETEKSCQTDYVPVVEGALFNPEEQTIVDMAKQIYDEVPRRDCFDTVVSRLLTVMKDQSRMVHLFYDHYDLLQNAKITACRGAFAEIYGRPMSLPEFLYHFPPLQFASTAEAKEAIRASKVEYDRLFQTLQDIYQQYTGSSITLEEVHEYHIHADAFHTADYRERVIDRVVHGVLRPGVYKSSLHRLLSEMYMDAFAVPLIPRDADYMVCVITGEMLDLHSKRIHDIMLRIKEETQECILDITQGYQRVLGRDPDPEEVDLYLDHYRSDTVAGDNHQKTRQKMEDALYESLEYNEVLKTRIIDVWKEKHDGQSPAPSVTYKWLALLVEKSEKRSLVGIRRVLFGDTQKTEKAENPNQT